MTRLVHTGNAIVDIALTIDDLPERGGDVLASSSAIAAGGAVNTLVAARRDGLDSLHVGARGTGPFADIVARALAAAGVRAAGPVVDIDTGYSVALVDSTAERTFVTSVGAEGRLTRADLDRAVLRPDDVVVVSGYSLAHSPSVLPGWVATLPSTVTVVLDPSPVVDTIDPGVLAAVLDRVDVLTANAREARSMIGGRAGSGSDDSARDAVALAGLLRPGASALVRAGANGCFVASAGGDEARHVAAFEVEAVDTTGAGDAHCGVLCAALSRGDSVDAAVLRANAAAALAVARRGPATSPSSAEIDALLGRAGL